jgi:hypothetical protein
LMAPSSTVYFRFGPGQTRRTTLRPNMSTLRPNIMATPTVAATIDATGIIVSGPK